MQTHHHTLPRIAATLLLSLGLGLATVGAWASGTRSADVSQALAADFPLLDAARLPVTLHYIGSTADNHVFMTVKTAVANGRPFDHLFSYRYPKDTLELINGWPLPEAAVHVRPQDCPRLTIKPPPQHLTLPPDRRLRDRCLPPPAAEAR